MILWYITVFCAVAVGFSVFWSVRRRFRRNGKELAVVGEIAETGAIAIILIALGFVMLVGKIAGMEIGGTDDNSFLFVGIFGAVMVLVGCEVLMRSVVNRVVAYHDKIVAHTYFGNDRVIYWSSVTEVKVQQLSRRATFKTEKDSIGVNGKRSEYQKLIVTAKGKVPALVGSDTLGRLARRLEK